MLTPKQQELLQYLCRGFASDSVIGCVLTHFFDVSAEWAKHKEWATEEYSFKCLRTWVRQGHLAQEVGRAMDALSIPAYND